MSKFEGPLFGPRMILPEKRCWDASQYSGQLSEKEAAKICGPKLRLFAAQSSEESRRVFIALNVPSQKMKMEEHRMEFIPFTAAREG